ncbi:MAG: hypothetical protein E6Q76_03130 [Rhizobium sp.]|nr:MAG: hypothetical protein E6Q76_03130 [Rhizobium sp.]
MNKQRFTILGILLASSALGACNGHVDTGSSSSSTTLHGTAATGAAVSGGTIDLKCLNSSSSYTTTSQADGSYSIDVSDTPCVIRLTYGSPAQTLYSLATAAGVTDISPFTDLVFTALAQETPDAAYNAFPGNASSFTSSALAAAIDLVKRRLNNLGVDASSLDLLHQSFSPVSGDPYDDKLETLKSDLQAQSLALSNLEDDVAHGRDQPASVPVQTPVLSMAEPGDGLVRLSWSPAQNGVSYDVEYDVVTTPAPGASIPPPSNKVSGVSSPVNISGLTDGTEYYFVIHAHNGSESKDSNQRTSTPHLYGVNFTAYPGYSNNGVSPYGGAYVRTAENRDVFVGVYDTQHIIDVELNPADNSATPQNIDTTGGSGTAQKLYAVAGGKGVLIAVGAAGTVLYSANGHDWSPLHPPIANPGQSTLPEAGVTYHSISYANGRFVLVGRYSLEDGATGDLMVMMSFNAEDAPACPGGGCSSSAPYTKSVTYLSPAISSGGDGLEVVSYGNGQFVALGNPSLAATNADDFGNTYLADGSTFVYTSPDGETWTRHTIAPANKVQQTPVRMVYAFGSFYALTYANGGLYKSTDGLSWSSTTGVSFVGSHPQDIAVGPGQMVSGDQLGDSFVCTNGSSWKENESGIGGTGNGGSATAMAYGNGIYVAFGHGVYHSE